nr:MAG TPA: hypothetical protein [Caudoviricetes sp.]
MYSSGVIPLSLIVLISYNSDSSKSYCSGSWSIKILIYSSLLNESQALSTIAPVSSSNLIFPGSVIPLRRSTSVVKSSSCYPEGVPPLEGWLPSPSSGFVCSKESPPNSSSSKITSSKFSIYIIIF